MLLTPIEKQLKVRNFCQDKNADSYKYIYHSSAIGINFTNSYCKRSYFNLIVNLYPDKSGNILNGLFVFELHDADMSENGNLMYTKSLLFNADLSNNTETMMSFDDILKIIDEYIIGNIKVKIVEEEDSKCQKR